VLRSAVEVARILGLAAKRPVRSLQLPESAHPCGW
jgi:hypothetical protein